MLGLFNFWRIQHAVTLLHKGGVIAYPTEAVFGLGCDPLNQSAVKRLLIIKQRPVAKGLILIAASWEQLQPFVQEIDAELLQKVQATWPGPYTWLFPASEQVPKWVRGQHTTIAVRVTAHPIARALCNSYGAPIVSTSANLADVPPLTSAKEVKKQFAGKVDYVFPGRVGSLAKPTEIRNAITGVVIREG